MNIDQKEERDALIVKWQEAKLKLDELKETESKLRAEVLKNAFEFDPETLRQGTENLELGMGYKLKAVFKINHTFVGGQEAVEKALQKIEKTGAEGEFIAERLVKWKPSLSLTEYKQLPEKFRKIIDDVVCSKEATPTLEIVEPKAKK